MLIDIRPLQVRIGATPIPHDVHLGLSEGEIYGLGSNGAGKITPSASYRSPPGWSPCSIVIRR